MSNELSVLLRPLPAFTRWTAGISFPRISAGNVSESTQGPSWGYLKVIFSGTLSIFGDKCPQNGSKNEPMAPRTNLECPHIGVCVVAQGAALKSTVSGELTFDERFVVPRVVIPSSPYAECPNLLSSAPLSVHMAYRDTLLIRNSPPPLGLP